MSKPAQNLSVLPNVTKEALDVMSGAFATWLHNANRLQSEAIRFLSDRFNKDVQMMSQFATCKKPEEIFELQAKLSNSLVSDYLTEGSKLLALFGDAVKEEAAQLSKTLGSKR